LFIPFDCRTQGSEKILTNQNINKHQETFHNCTNNNTCTNLNSGWVHPDNSSSICKCTTQLEDLQINLDSLKLNYQLEMEKINNKFVNLSSSVQKTYLLNMISLFLDEFSVSGDRIKFTVWIRYYPLHEAELK
jgi:hypothetical protein